jgi:hypothetical protein
MKAGFAFISFYVFALSVILLGARNANRPLLAVARRPQSAGEENDQDQ